MEKLISVSRRDIIVLVSFLVTVAALFGFARLDVTQKRKELATKAEAHVAKFYEGLVPEDYEHLLEVQSDKAYSLFGKQWGVIRIYTRKKADTAMESFIGIEYFYEHGDQGWQLADTAQIKEPQYIYEAYNAFEKAGYTVDDEAYLRYNR